MEEDISKVVVKLVHYSHNGKKDKLMYNIMELHIKINLDK
jgi:hypothetical protein